MDETAFQEAGRVALASVAFGVVGILGALGFWIMVQRGQVPNLGKILFLDAQYIQTNMWALFGSVVVYVVASLVAVWATGWLITRHAGATLSPSHSMWTEVFRKSRPPGTATYIRASTVSGELWEGVVGHFTADLETDGRELVLFAPISHGTRASNAVEFDPEAQRVVLKGDQLESISVRYAMYETPASDSTSV